MRLNRRFLTRAFVALLLLEADPAGAQALPDARSIIDRYVEAIGGDLLRSHTSMRTTGTFSLPGMGSTGQLEMAQARPNRMVMTVTLPGLGAIRSGFDGTVGWSVNPMEGPRLLSGKELEQQSDDAAFESALRDASLIESMETVELTEIEGTACHIVRITWKSGRETRDCYAVDSGLLIATMARSETVMGPVDATMLYGDYQDFGGIRMPSRTRQRVMSQEFVMTITAVEFGNVDDAAFKPPQEVLTLLKNRAVVR
ncbi:MAG: hypothetical protein ACREL7_00760 [Longimicrobiales bacterium]